MDAVRQLFDIARDPRQSKWISPLLIAVDAALCGVIIWKVPCKSVEVIKLWECTEYLKTLRSTGRHTCNK